MSQLSEIPGDNRAVPAEAEASPRQGRRGRKSTLTREERLRRIAERNHKHRQIWSMPPVNLKCDCNEPATMWSNSREPVCAHCDFLYSMAKRMEIHGRTLGFSRKSSGKYIPVEKQPEIQMELFFADVVYLADEIMVVGHGVYHLHLEKEAA